MAVTQAQIDALNQAIADGVRSVTLPGGQTTIYATLPHLIEARDNLRQEIFAEAAATGTAQRRGRMTLASYGGRAY
jgi:hypothetical protein